MIGLPHESLEALRKTKRDRMNFSALLSLLLMAPVCVMPHTCCFTCSQGCDWNSTSSWLPPGATLTKIPSPETTRIAARSFTPWNYISDTDADRIPQTIWTAYCQHKKCWQNQGVEFALNYTITVFYRRPCPDSSRYHLVPGKFTVTVGCTCIHRRTMSLATTG
ncbi:interleukin-17A-like [Scleropages formosus]|uniref:interleukin-17A-like n=1 Tax=Scleropages formosus TaxID=113540 RepID=UPI0010FACBC8|nr:interleukin-17A-like [Scleropages formosus]